MAKTPVIVASHTHWDRAWYFPFQQFRFLLVHTIDDLLETLKRRSDFEVFNLDGQAIVLEDYLAIRPDKRDELAGHIRSGRITAGPWYILPDEYLVSGEALIRNLAIGMDTVGEFGRPMDTSYIPDTFGHVSQMPQILRGVGLDSIIFARGLPRAWEGHSPAFRWVGPDGKSWVYALVQAQFYGNASSLSVYPGEWFGQKAGWADTVKPRVEKLLAGQEERNHPGVLLLCNGMDHMPAEPDIGKVIARLNKEFPAYRFVHGSYEDYVREVRKRAKRLPRAQGEMHEGAFSPILSGVFSARRYLKQANFRCQAILERQCEPLAAAAAVYGDAYPHQPLTHAWKKLLKNHPHDDICGCSVDPVHDDMETRFRNVAEEAEFISSRSISWLGYNVEAPAPLSQCRAIAFNGLPRNRKTMLTARLAVPSAKGCKSVLDDRGLALPTTPGPVEHERKLVWNGELKQAEQRDFYWQHMSFQAELPACGWAQFGLGESEPAPAEVDLQTASDTIENENLRVTMARDGSVTITDKKTRRKIAGGNVFEDQADAGDEYDFSPIADDKPLTSAGRKGKLKARLLGSAAAEITCELTLKIPAGLTADRKARARRTVDLPIRTTARLTPGATRVEFVTTVDNRATDHRLRVAFPTGLRSETVDVAQHFDIIQRPVKIPVNPDDAQPAVQTQHCDEFVAVSEGPRGVALLNRGLPEYQARNHRGRVSLVQTLLRCCGWLSRGDLSTRRQNAGPPMAAPGAQCLGEHTFEYAVAPMAGSVQVTRIWNEAMDYCTPTFCRGIRESGPPKLPARAELLSVGDSRLIVSAVKGAARGRIAVRVWNAADSAVTSSLSVGFDLKGAALADMRERPGKKLSCAAGTVKLPKVAPKEIVTVLLTPASAGLKAPTVHREPYDTDGRVCW